MRRMNIRTRTGALLAAVLTGVCMLNAQPTAQLPEHLRAATAWNHVLGDGRKTYAVVLEYDTPIRNSSLSASSYRVEGQEVLAVYARSTPGLADKGCDGPYVMIVLRSEVDLNAQPRQPTAADLEKKKERDRMQGGPGLRAGWSTGGDNDYPGSVTVVQMAGIRTTRGKLYAPAETPFETTSQQCLVADDFRQAEFQSPYTGQVLPYNIYLPTDYNPQEQYPLVLSIHDAGTASGPVTQTLYQGTGATSWAEPQAQARHKCIVVAPEYPVVTVDDNWNYSHHLDATVALIRQLQQDYSIDASRIYLTGQSMGCMSSIVLMLKEPQLFAGALLVAGKWNVPLMAPLKDQNIWIISCEGDASSNTLQGQAVALWRSQGAVVAEDTWDMTLPPAGLSACASRMAAQGTHLLFTHLVGGSHRATWFVAYGIEAVQDWLFSCHRQ